MDWDVVTARRRGYSASFAVGTIVSTLVFTGWATWVGPTAGSGANALYDAYMNAPTDLLLAALAVWLASLFGGVVAWFLLVARHRSLRPAGRTWLQADGILIVAATISIAFGAWMSATIPALDIVVRTGTELGDTSFVINPAGAAGRFVILGALLAYAVAASLAIANDWTEGRPTSMPAPPA
jgi:hypothetical protein